MRCRPESTSDFTFHKREARESRSNGAPIAIYRIERVRFVGLCIHSGASVAMKGCRLGVETLRRLQIDETGAVNAQL